MSILQHCPLAEIDLSGTSCITPSYVDFSRFTYLKYLNLNGCKQTGFTVTGLPDTLQILKIEGLTEKNFQLSNTNGTLGDSLKEIQISQPRMCSPAVMKEIFRRELSHVRCVLEILDTVYT